MLVFSTQLCELLPLSNLLSGSPPHPPLCVAGRGWGVLSPVGDHFSAGV
jgi:hypothetical protein